MNYMYVKMGLEWIKRRYPELVKDRLSHSELYHYGIKGMKWGVRRTPEQLGHRKQNRIVVDALKSGLVTKEINEEKQKRHTKTDHTPGRSYLDGDLDFSRKLIDKYAGRGEAKLDRNGNWNRRERFVASNDIGAYVDENGMETRSNVGMIIYSRTGTHVYPVRRKDDRNED